MTTNAKYAAIAAACVIGITTACDVPVLPQWDTKWNVPLPSQAVPLPVGVIPNGFPPQQVSFPTLVEPLDKSIGDLLRNAADTGSVILTLSKTVNLSGTDTLYVAADSNAFNNPAITRIAIPVSFTAADRTVVDTVSTNFTLIRTTAEAGGNIYIKLRGSVSNNSGSTVTVTPADSIHVRLALLTLIHSSK